MSQLKQADNLGNLANVSVPSPGDTNTLNYDTVNDTWYNSVAGGAVSGEVIDGWINFNGLAFTVNDSYNVAGIVDNAAGDYTITWDTDFANSEYSAVISSGRAGADPVGGEIFSLASGITRIRFTRMSDAGALLDVTTASVMVIGDQ